MCLENKDACRYGSPPQCIFMYLSEKHDFGLKNGNNGTVSWKCKIMRFSGGRFGRRSDSKLRPLLSIPVALWQLCLGPPPHLVTQIQKLEKNHKRAARFVTGNQILEHGNTKLNMNSLGWYPMQERRAKLKLTFLYKIINSIISLSQIN